MILTIYPKCMILDIILVVILLIAAVIGMRQGLITQLCLLLAIVLTTVVTPIIAKPMGSLFTDNEILAYIAGFCIMLLITVVIVWVVAPLIKKHLLGDKLRKVNALIGAIVAIITTTILLSVVCTTLNTFNLGTINTVKANELREECKDMDEFNDKFEKLIRKDSEMRDYFEPRFISYETLDDSILFGAFVWMGDIACPSISTLRSDTIANLKEHIHEGFALTIVNNDDCDE